MIDLREIKNTMSAHLLEIGTDPSKALCRPEDSEINLPNSVDKPTGKKPYISVTYPFSTTLSSYEGQAVTEEVMLMQVDIIGSAGETKVGSLNVDDIASSVKEQFKKGTQIGNLTIEDTPSINGAIEESEEYRISLTITFSYFVE